MNKEIYQEDLQHIALEAEELVEKKLKEFGIVLSPEQDDQIYVPIVEALDKICKNPYYRHEH